jgi:two-component system, LuxR family, sensor kinase FixL
LMAAGVYMRLVADTINLGNADTSEVAETAKKAVAQVDRAAEVIRRVRALVQLDRTNRSSVAFQRIVKQAIEVTQSDLDRANVTTRFHSAGQLPLVMVDVLQIEQVILNLMRNSIDAIRNSGANNGSIVVEAKLVSDEFIEVGLFDTGPGFTREQVESGFLPLSSTKPDGLGVGLPLCKSIIEVHGGRLWVDEDPRGTPVRFTLPVTIKSDHV